MNAGARVAVKRFNAGDTTNQNLLFVSSACVLLSVLAWRWVLGVTRVQVAWIALTQTPHFALNVTLFNVLLWSVVQLVLAELAVSLPAGPPPMDRMRMREIAERHGVVYPPL